MKDQAYGGSDTSHEIISSLAFQPSSSAEEDRLATLLSQIEAPFYLDLFDIA